MCLKIRHLYFFTFFLCLAHSRLMLATELNFLNSQLLRMKETSMPLGVINPLLTREDKKDWGGNLNAIGEKDFYSFYHDISSKNQTQINQRVNNSFGIPYSFFTNINAYKNIKFTHFSYIQNIDGNMGGSFYLTDPVFPEVNTLLFQSYGASSEFFFASPNNYKINFSLHYGRLRMLQKKLNVGDLIESKPSFRLAEAPYKFYLDLGIDSEYNLYNLGNVIVKVNSVPVFKQDYEVYDTFVGIITNNILPTQFKTIDHFKIYTGYSPFYRGDYSVERTLVFGSTIGINSWLNFDLFTTDHTYVGGLLKVGTNAFNASFFSYQESYDDFGVYKFRNYGLNLNLNF